MKFFRRKNKTVEKPAEEQNKKSEAELFSTRMGGVFGRMYRMILSADL